MKNYWCVQKQDSLYTYDDAKDQFVIANNWGELFGVKGGTVLPKMNEKDGVLWMDYFIEEEKWLLSG